MIEFGLGLIGIGRSWGFANSVVPEEGQATRLLERAFELGVHYFDTAPSYGLSEERLGRFLGSLTAAERSQATIATKFGEHWDAVAGQPFVDHSYEALRRSLDQSVERLGNVAILQLHKTRPEVLVSRDLERAWEYAGSLGIRQYGASVSDAVSAQLAVESGRYCLIQVPYNAGDRVFEPAIEAAAAAGVRVAVNRPFAMGKMLYQDQAITKAQAFRFILQKGFEGVILSGTKSPEHLAENWRAFQEAAAS